MDATSLPRFSEPWRSIAIRSAAYLAAKWRKADFEPENRASRRNMFVPFRKSSGKPTTSVQTSMFRLVSKHKSSSKLPTLYARFESRARIKVHVAGQERWEWLSRSSVHNLCTSILSDDRSMAMFYVCRMGPRAYSAGALLFPTTRTMSCTPKCVPICVLWNSVRWISLENQIKCLDFHRTWKNYIRRALVHWYNAVYYGRHSRGVHKLTTRTNITN